MSVGEKICSAVRPIVHEIMAGSYTGDADSYCTYNMSEQPMAFGDDTPWVIRYLIQLHWYAPLGINPTATKRALRAAILGAGFTAPVVEDASDLDGIHLVFEFEDVDGDF